MNQLQNIVQQETLRLTTAFASQSFLKARIQKLGQAQSWRWAGLKFVLVLPILVLCALWAFSFYQPGTLFPVEKNGKIGFMNEKGELIIPYQFTQYHSINYPYIIATISQENWDETSGLYMGGWGVIDFTGKTIIPFEHSGIESGFSEDFIAVRKNQKWGFLNEKGKTVIPFEYDYAQNFRYGLAPVRLGDKRGFIDKNNKIVIPLMYHKAFHFSENLLRVETYPDFEHLLINQQNQIIAHLPYYHTIGALKDGLALVSKENLSGFIDENGKELIPLIYNAIQGDFQEDIMAVRKDKKFGFIDKTGNTIIPFQYDWAGNFIDGLAPVAIEKNGVFKYGFIDKAQKFVIPLEYEDTGLGFHEGLVGVAKSGKYGFIDQNGKTIIPFQYTMVSNFQNDFALVMQGKRTFYIDRKGNEVKVKK